MENTSDRFGLLVIGNEILDGRRNDAHLSAFRNLLRQKRLELAYTLYLPDEMNLLIEQFRWAFSQHYPFFSCGGIGGTPDDLSRQAAAHALHLPLIPHPEGLRIINKEFGRRINPARQRMVEFPEGAKLIPNPVNRVPGFSIQNGYFVPGFPEMAHPMMQWVLEQSQIHGEEKTRRAFILPGAREGDISELMELFIAEFPDISFSCLPHIAGTEEQKIVLGIYGKPERINDASRRWREILNNNRIPFHENTAD